MIDVQFPILEYIPGHSHREWGRQHGEQWREGIAELIHIRTELMREKNPRLNRPLIAELAVQQWAVTSEYDAELTEELTGIAEGAQVSTQDLVVLNNYTDFRDIDVSDQGCSSIYVHRNGNRLAGQTWDMHGSAKRFLCCMKIPRSAIHPEMILFSIVGCVGMMGYSAEGNMVGVNNLNTSGARPGALWPVIVRKLLQTSSRTDQQKLLQAAPFTSGRSFLLAGRQGGEFWEVAPGLTELVSRLAGELPGHLFHTNHCFGHEARLRETKLALTSTTHVRFELLEKKIATVQDLSSAWELLNDHDGYPRSICSNFQTSSQDPSITCGGAIGDLNTGEIRMWRGDKLYDKNYVEHRFQLIGPE